MDLLPDGSKEIQYAALLPANVKRLLETHTGKKISIPLKSIPPKNAQTKIEAICRKFLDDRNAQKKLDYAQMLTQNVTLDGQTVLYSSQCLSLEAIEEKLESEDFYYPIDPKTGRIESVIIGRPKEIVAGSKKAKIKDGNGKTWFRGAETHLLEKHIRYLSFGKAFRVDLDAKKFVIKPSGRLSERINQIEFAVTIIENGRFFIDEIPFEVNFGSEKLEMLKNWRTGLSELRNNLKVLRIEKDPNLDKWTSDGLKNALLLTSCLSHGETLPRFVERVSCGNLKLGDLSLGYVFVPVSNGNRAIDVLSMDKSLGEERLSCVGPDGKSSTKNPLCFLQEEFYLSDNFNFSTIESYIKRMSIDDNAFAPLNIQGLWMIKAYDRTKNERYLELAMTLYNRLSAKTLDKETENDIVLNKLQITARKGTLTSADKKNLVMTKDESAIEFVKIGCLILLGGFEEAKLRLGGLTEKEKSWFSRFPIMNLLPVPTDSQDAIA